MSDTKYDVFISYSSKDERSVKMIHRFLEGYKPPKGVCPHGQQPRIKAFRDKSDQGAASDYESAFHTQIEQIPSFLLVGSRNALKSEPVLGEVACMLNKDEPNLNLAWVDDQMPPQFPEGVAKRYPRALYADLRVLPSTNVLRWWLKDRKRFRFETLRIVAKVLSQKTNSRIDLDQLIQRHEQRARTRCLIAVAAILVCLLAFTSYYISTPECAWHYTGIGTEEVTGYWFRIDGHTSEPKLLVVNEWEKPWEDEISGDSGFDSEFTVYQLDERGVLEARLSFETFDVDRGLEEDSLVASGVFSSWNQPELVRLADQARNHFREEENRNESVMSLPDEIDNLGLYSDHTVYRAPGNRDLCFVASHKDTNPYDPIEGGLFRSNDGGRSWESLDPIDALDGWESFDDVVCHPNDGGRFAVSLASVVGTNLSAPFEDPTMLPSAWLTNDGGDTWAMLDSGPEKVDAGRINLIAFTSSGRVFALVSYETGGPRLVLYGKRSFWDRVFQRFDDV